MWRWLHIERDSMGAPGNANTVHGTIKAVENDRPQAGQSWVFIDQTLGEESRNQYENGIMSAGGASYTVIENINICLFPNWLIGDCLFSPFLFFQGIRARVTITITRIPLGLQGNPFTLHDDDDDTALPRLPDLNLIQNDDAKDKNLFSWAYIRPINDGGGGKTNEQDFPFDLNTSDDEAMNPNYYTPRHQSIGANDEVYWVVYLLSIFQGPLLEDFDPNQQVGILGWCVLPGNPCGNLSILYVEQYRDPGGCRGLEPQAGVRSGLQATVAHEIGHSFGGMHKDGGIMASEEQACLKNNPQFTDITLNRIRSTRKPGG